MYKRYISLCLLLSCLLAVLGGCGFSGGKEVLTVLTEQSTWDRMNGQISMLETAFEKDRPDVDVQVVLLPKDKLERDVTLQQLRTEILQGGGPDCYLLPTDNTLILDTPAQYTYVEIEPLFADVALAMQGGLFYDLSALYDADDALGKAGLNEKIMSAGVVDGKRYVLPLRYDVPMIYALTDRVTAAGLDTSVLQADILTLMDAVYATGDPQLAGGILYEDYSAFSGFLDYDSGTVSLTAQTLGAYMASYQRLRSLLGEKYVDNSPLAQRMETERAVGETRTLLENLEIEKYIRCAYSGLRNYYPLWIGSMQHIFDYAPLSQYEDTALTVTPMRSVDGDVVATVTFYGAIGSGCKDPALAYDFLRRFLSEDSQWEKNRPERNHTKPLKGQGPNTSNDLQYPGLIENGWPVRDQDALPTLWTARRLQFYVKEFYGNKTMKQRMRQIGLMGTLEEDRVSGMEVEVDCVRFHSAISDSLQAALDRLNDWKAGNAPTDTQLSEVVQQLLRELRWHISEG